MIWTLREKGVTDIHSLLQNTSDPEARAVLNQMMKEGLFEMDGDILNFKEKGEALAEGIVRRHRLTERLLMELFEMSEEEAEEEACKLEHILSPAVTDSVCSFLGHPPVCPHGKPIPQGDCCKKLTREMKPLIRPLNDLALGQEGRVGFYFHQGQRPSGAFRFFWGYPRRRHSTQTASPLLYHPDRRNLHCPG